MLIGGLSEKRNVANGKIGREHSRLPVYGLRVVAALGTAVIGANLCMPKAIAQLGLKEGHAARKVFQIGSFDRSSEEFASGQPSRQVDFIVGESNPASDWYAVQPAVLRGLLGKETPNDATAPRTITFALTNVPLPAYTLHVALLIETASVPALRVSINDKHGTFLLQPKLDARTGAMAGSFDPAHSHADVTFTFPGGYLHPGRNEISLQGVEQADREVHDASLIYDAIELDGDMTGVTAWESAAQIVPTIFYRRRKDGLEESVDITLHHDAPIRQGSSVELTLDGKHYVKKLEEDEDFGDEEAIFSVPEFPKHSEAQLSWNMAGETLHTEEVLNPKKKWTLFLVPHIHLDVGYSDYQAKVAAVQSRVIDEAMSMTAQHPDFRFSLDGEWDLAQFMKTRTLAEQQRAITAIQKKQLFVPAQYANLLTGFPTAETLIRSLYASANFSREHGTPFNYANITDVPSYSWSYASILAAAGIKYFLAGANYHNARAPVLPQGHLDEDSPFWWEGPDGKKVLLWYSRGYSQTMHFFGLPPLLSAVRETLPLFLQMYEHPSYHADATILFGTQPENTDLFPQQAELAQRWNSEYAYPRFKYSGFHEALENIAQQFGKETPTVSGDGGPYWEDGIASDAYYAAMERDNEARGPSAEKLSTLTSLVDPKLAADKVDLDRMWNDMVLMDEHTWDSSNSISDPTSAEAVQQLEVKNLYAMKAHALTEFVTRNSMASLADSISTGRGSLIVFNTLNWARDGLVSFDLPKGHEIVDTTTGRVVPVEILGGGKDFQHVRFVAENVPAVGYKTFQLRHTKGAVLPATVAQMLTLESPYYRVELEPASGAVLSIYDKQLKRELVDRQSPYRFGQYLYVTGGNREPNRLLDYRVISPKPTLRIHPARGGRLVSVSRTPYGWVARMESTDINTPRISTEIQIFDSEKKIEFTEGVLKKNVDTKEGVYFAFPFAMDSPQFQYEIQNGVVDPAKDMYPGAGHEWFSVQHWISVQQNGISATVVPLDASLVTLGDINRGDWPDRFGQRRGTIFSYIMNNYWFTNYRAGQGGRFRFRYVISSGPSTDSARLSQMGWEEVTPLELDQVTHQDKALDTLRPLNGNQMSLLEVNDPDLVLDTWKPAEDGDGTILRFLDLGGATRTVTVQTPLLEIRQAWRADAVERNQKPLSLRADKGFRFTIHPHEIVTVRLVSRPRE